MIQINDTEKQFISRINEISEKSLSKSMYFETDFLTLSEQNLIRTNIKGSYNFWGGYEYSERKIAIFGNEEDIGYSYMFEDFIFLHIYPISRKFSEKLSHRDFLGTIMSLGINRNTFGDLILKDLDAYTVCKKCIADYLIENLSNIRHTNVICEAVDQIPEDVFPKLIVKTFVISSERIDSIISSIYLISRSESKALIEHGKVLVNGSEMLKADYVPIQNTIITVSGHGKFIYIGYEKETKKGRLRCTAQIFS